MDRTVARLNIEHFHTLLERKRTRLCGQSFFVSWQKKKRSWLSSMLSRSKRTPSFSPFPPVCRTHVDRLPGFRLDPSAEDTPAWEYECVRTVWVSVNHSKLKVAIERRARYVLPNQLKNLINKETYPY